MRVQTELEDAKTPVADVGAGSVSGLRRSGYAILMANILIVLYIDWHFGTISTMDSCYSLLNREFIRIIEDTACLVMETTLALTNMGRNESSQFIRLHWEVRPCSPMLTSCLLTLSALNR